MLLASGKLLSRVPEVFAIFDGRDFHSFQHLSLAQSDKFDKILHCKMYIAAQLSYREGRCLPCSRLVLRSKKALRLAVIVFCSSRDAFRQHSGVVIAKTQVFDPFTPREEAELLEHAYQARYLACDAHKNKEKMCPKFRL